MKHIQEPWRTALTILEEQYVVAPKNLPTLPVELPDFIAMNAANTVYDMIKENPLTYVSVINKVRGKLLKNIRSISTGILVVPSIREYVCIMGCAYYALAMDGVLDKHQLGIMEKMITGIDVIKAADYFSVFKQAAEKKKPEAHGLKTKKNMLSTTQAALFCEVMAKVLNLDVRNKKTDLAPLASTLSGWEQSTIEKKFFEGYSDKDRAAVFELFSTMATSAKDFGKKMAARQDSGESAK